MLFSRATREAIARELRGEPPPAATPPRLSGEAEARAARKEAELARARALALREVELLSASMRAMGQPAAEAMGLYVPTSEAELRALEARELEEERGDVGVLSPAAAAAAAAPPPPPPPPPAPPPPAGADLALQLEIKSRYAAELRRELRATRADYEALVAALREEAALRQRQTELVVESERARVAELARRVEEAEAAMRARESAAEQRLAELETAAARARVLERENAALRAELTRIARIAYGRKRRS
jgi:hypothetical protein